MTKTCVEFEGAYIQVRERIRPLVALLAAGCSEEEVRREVQRLKPPGPYLETRQLRQLIDRLFAAHGIALEESGGVWHLRPVSGGKDLSHLGSALRCRVTLVPEALANEMALAFKFLYAPAGVVAAFLFCALSLTLYALRCGVHALSLGVLFRSLQQVSAAGVVFCIVAIIFASLFHELGHCAAVAAFGARVRRIGFGIYWFSPALFSDVSAAWTLTRWQRVTVDCGGIYFQLLACACYGLFAAYINSTAIQLALRIAIAVNLVAVLSALNPLLKYDGYWIVSDALSIPNLRHQSERTIGEFMRNVIKRRNGEIAVALTPRFLVGYGVLSMVYSAALLFLFVVVIRHNAMEAMCFPKEAWTFFKTGLDNGNAAAQWTHLGFDFLKVIPVACAPIAVLTASSAVAGFLKRAFAGSRSN